MKTIKEGVKLFFTESFLTLKKKMCYREVFKKENIAVRAVLADLDKFCDRNVTKHAGHPIDEKTVFIAIGRRQVMDYLHKQCKITDEEINQIAQEEQQERMYGRNNI